MTDALAFAAFVLIWFVVNRWILPRFGVST